MKTIFGNLAKYLTFLLLLSACNSREKDMKCEDLRTGKFLFHSEVSGTTTIIERNDSIQVETIENTGSVFKARIVWNDACSYDLIYSDSRLRGSDSIAQDIMKKPLKTRIIAAENDYYIFETTIPGENFFLKDTFKILR